MKKMTDEEVRRALIKLKEGAHEASLKHIFDFDLDPEEIDYSIDTALQAIASQNHRCVDCKYLHTEEDRGPGGYRCSRPSFYRTRCSANFKQKWAPACKGFEKRDEGENEN